MKDEEEGQGGQADTQADGTGGQPNGGAAAPTPKPPKPQRKRAPRGGPGGLGHVMLGGLHAGMPAGLGAMLGLTVPQPRKRKAKAASPDQEAKAIEIAKLICEPVSDFQPGDLIEAKPGLGHVSYNDLPFEAAPYGVVVQRVDPPACPRDAMNAESDAARFLFGLRWDIVCACVDPDDGEVRMVPLDGRFFRRKA